MALPVYPYPCGCNTTISNPTPSSNCDNCLYVPPVIIDENSNLTACGAAAPVSTVDVPNIPNAKFSVCTGALTWKLFGNDATKFHSLSIDANGVISFQFSTLAVPGEVLMIQGKVWCSDPTLSAVFQIKVPVYNPCVGKICDTGQVCNTCTGLCEAEQLDIIVE